MLGVGVEAGTDVEILPHGLVEAEGAALELRGVVQERRRGPRAVAGPVRHPCIVRFLPMHVVGVRLHLPRQGFEVLRGCMQHSDSMH